jgi:hypothetical protein
MRLRQRSWGGNVADSMILQPVSMVYCIKPNIGMVQCVKLHEEPPILQA